MTDDAKKKPTVIHLAAIPKNLSEEQRGALAEKLADVLLTDLSTQ